MQETEFALDCFQDLLERTTVVNSSGKTDQLVVIFDFDRNG